MSTITVSTVLETTKQKVWEALTDTTAMKQWYFEMENFKLEKGNVLSFYEPGGKEFFHQCKVLDFHENEVFSHTWTHPNESKGTSTVTWRIEDAQPGKVKVTLTHEGLESFADGGEKFAPSNYEMGWNALVKTNLRNYVYGIKKLVFEQKINASAEKIWGLMWDKESYKVWVEPFCAGTYFTGEITQGSRIQFLTPSGEGMFADVFYLVPNKIVIFRHIGNVSDFEEQPIDEETEKWTGCFELYKLHEENGSTTLTAEVDCVPEYLKYMNEKFPPALQKLKEIAE